MTSPGLAEHASDDGGEVKCLLAARARLSPGEGEEGVEQPLLLRSCGQHPLVGGVEAVGRRVGVRQRHLGDCSLTGQRGAKLV